MNVALMPPETAGLPPIRMSDVLLPIGCDESWFRDLPAQYRSQLSERHARIFQDEVEVYVVDLDSRLGTRLNGILIAANPVPLFSGDELTFGNDLTYCVEIESSLLSAADEVDQSTQDTLILTATDARLELEPLAIERFPFLVGKHQPALASWIEQQPRALSFLSRRHTQISRDGVAFIVEDLSSTNGTWINGVRERGSTRPLLAGDTIAFGQEGLSFRVEIMPSSESAALIEGTILISSAESFLDIYCQSDSAESDVSSPNAADQVKPASTGSAVAVDVARNLGTSLRPGFWSLRQRIVGGGMGVALVVVSALWLAQDDRPEQIRALLANAQPAAALELAHAYLADHPNDDAVKLALDEAVRDATVPQWLAAYSAQDWQQANQLLERVGAVAVNPSAASWVDTLRWITAAASFEEQTNNVQRVRLFRDERPLSALVADLAQPSSPPGPELRELLNAHPRLGEVYRQALSTLRRMKNYAQTYLPAMNDLRQQVRDALDGNQTEYLAIAFEVFAERYQRIEGVAQLQTDLASYTRLTRVTDDSDIAGFAELEADLAFVTAPFQRAAQEHIDSLGNARRDAKRWRVVQRTWAQGELDAALDGLTALTGDVWQLGVSAQKNRWRNQRDEYNNLRSSRDADESETAARLSALFLQLDVVEDRWLHAQVVELLRAKQGGGELLARQGLAVAQQAWQEFQLVGGIDSKLRLEPEATVAFRTQAELLERAHDNVREALALVYFLDSESSVEATNLRSAVTAEIARQRQALEGLKSVLDQSVVNAKLVLIPNLESL